MMTNERTQAVALANRLLDEPNCDPDDDLRVLSRQLLRAVEVIDRVRANEPSGLRAPEPHDALCRVARGGSCNCHLAAENRNGDV